MPEPIVRRRLEGLVNFDRLYRPLATTWRLYDRGAAGACPLIARGATGRAPVVLDTVTWQEIRKRSRRSDEPTAVA